MSNPVVSTKHAGIVDVISNNETGFLVNEGDVDEMTIKIIELLKNNELSKKMGTAGKQNILKNFSLAKHLTIVQECITKSLSND